MMDDRQLMQEGEYIFPYHHIPRIEQGKFTQLRELYWGYEYFSYLTIVKNIVSKKKFKTLIDVGCGDGRLLSEIKKLNIDGNLIGIDYSARAISIAKAFYPEIDFKKIDIFKESLLPACDIVTLMEVIEHIPPSNMAIFIKKLANIIKHEGTLILTTPTENLPTNKKHYQHFTLAKLNNLFKHHFILEKVQYVNRIALGEKLLRRVLSNRFFALQPLLSNTIYKIYTKKYLHGNHLDSKRIICVYKKLR